MSRVVSLLAFLRYSARQTFAGRFVYFLLLAVAVFFLVAIVQATRQAVPPSPETIYYFLLVPGVLLTLYPSAYALQGDLDAGMLETLFGIPDYRYKIWLVRQLVQNLVIAGLLTVLALFCRVALADFSVGAMVFHLMFPVAFLGALGLLLATLTRSGNGALAILVVVVLVFWISTEGLSDSRWFLYHNPFAQLDEVESLMRSGITFYNRTYLLAGTAACLLWALLRLQNRERYI